MAMTQLKETFESTLKFVQIVQRFPELYDPAIGNYWIRSSSNKTWNKVSKLVKTEIGEDCTASDAKIKWKGIRSSFSRYRRKLLEYKSGSIKKYYLYDALRFLDPYTTIKRSTAIAREGQNNSNVEQLTDTSGTETEDGKKCYLEIESEDPNELYVNAEEWEEQDIKPDILDVEINEVETLGNSEYENILPGPSPKISKIEVTETKVLEVDTHDKDMQFFKSILPDINHFTPKEKRKLKRGILQLIDQIEDERNGSTSKSDEEV